MLHESFCFRTGIAVRVRKVQRNTRKKNIPFALFRVEMRVSGIFQERGINATMAVAVSSPRLSRQYGSYCSYTRAIKLYDILATEHDVALYFPVFLLYIYIIICVSILKCILSTNILNGKDDTCAGYA